MKTAATTAVATRARKMPLTACKGRAFHSSFSASSSSSATTATTGTGTTTIIASSNPGVNIIFSRYYTSCLFGNRRNFDKHDDNSKLFFSSSSIGLTEHIDNPEHDDDDNNEEQLPQEEEEYNGIMNTKLRQECSTCPYRSKTNDNNDRQHNNGNNRYDDTEIQKDNNNNDRSGSIITESNRDYLLKQQRQQKSQTTKEQHHDNSHRHSIIRTSPYETIVNNNNNTSTTVIPCGEVAVHDDNSVPNDPKHTQPYHDVKYSVRRRVLKTSIPPVSSDDTTETTSIPPFTIIPLNSLPGKQQLIDTLQQNTAASYMALTEHFTNQDDPSYCGITTLLVVLNALSMDPNLRWKGGWRYFANETVLLSLHPCISKYNVIQRSIGITMEQFHRIATCQGLLSIMKRPCTNNSNNSDNKQLQPQQERADHNDEKELSNDDNRSSSSSSFGCTVDAFRNDIIKALSEHDDDSSHHNDSIIVVSFHRASLYQTGEGHFSPIAAYHTASDTVLVLDVARFKYQPYWVSVQALYNAMIPRDTCTNLSRGWYILQRQQQQRTNSNSGISGDSSSQKTHNFQSNSQHPKEMPKTTAMETKIEPTTETNDNAVRIPEQQQQSQPPPKLRSNWKSIITNEDMIPARLVPLAGHDVKNQCPVHSIKVNYCPIDQNFHK